MSERRLPRMSVPLDMRRHATSTPSSSLEHLLQSLGAHPSFSDALLGDLAEECARRESEGSRMAARCWYVREALRSTPHLLWNAMRHGGARGRMRAVSVIAWVALVPALAAIALLLRNGPPARLVIDSRYVSDGLIVNSTRPVKISMKVVDANGHALDSTGVRYGWVSGMPVPVTSRGVLTCTRAGDAIVRASLGALTTSVRLHCRPLQDVRVPGMMNLVAGGPAQDVPFEAIGLDGRLVTLLAGRIGIGDSTIASIRGQQIRGRAAGSTNLTMTFGDRGAYMSVQVYAPALSPEGILPGQHLAIAVELAGGEMRRWHLPASSENYFVMMLPGVGGQQMPGLAIVGANCDREFGDYSFYCAAPRGMSVIVYHPQRRSPGQRLSGTLAVWRQQ